MENHGRSPAITRPDMWQPLLAADPAFEVARRAFLDTWANEADPPPDYLLLADLARHLIRRLEAGETNTFDAVFDVVERWHVDGDASVREAATIGLLEGLQNQHLHESTRPADFEPWLRPETARWWHKLERFWATGGWE